MTQTDARGLALSAANAEAADRYAGTVAAYLGFRLDTGEHLKAALAADPEMPLALATRGCFLMMFCHQGLAAKAAEAQRAAQALADGATTRERSHIAALGAWCAGDLDGAVRLWEAILLEHPRDILALRLAHYMHFYLGDAANLRDSVARVMPAWDETVPGYGKVLGMYAFGLEEAGEYAGAEALGRRAVEHDPADIWAAHAVAHVMEMQGRQRDGIAWISELGPYWADVNNFAYHVWWHRALFHLELEDYDAVLAAYDDEVRADRNEEYIDIANAAALLWRLEEEGVGVGDRWAELAEKSARRIDDHFLAFADAHYMMALVAGGRDAEAESMCRSLRAAAAGPGTQAPLLSALVLPLGEAMRAARRGDHDGAVDALLPIRYDLHRLGGSHAQRDVFARLLISAALGAGRHTLARALLAERTALRPGSPWSWKAYARALAALGDRAGAETARAQAARLLAA